MTAVNDYSHLPDAEFQELLDRIDREPEAPEAFDAKAALRRVLALADEWEANPIEVILGGANYAVAGIRAAVAGQP
jgi:hypothetical protein